MFKTLQNALKVKELRKKLLFTFWMLVIVRLGSQIPVPGTNSSVIQNILKSNSDAFSFLNSITGGSFESFSIFALSITPYITSSIIMQLLTIAIPALEEMNKDGEDGRKKIAAITRYVTIGLALIQSAALSFSFGNQGLITNPTWFDYLKVVITLTAGSAMLMWIGERITEKGVGNGISIVLIINIISRIPNDIQALYDQFISGKGVAPAILAIVIIVAIILAVTVFVIYLQDGTRPIPVLYSKKTVGRRMIGGQSSSIPLKVNTAGVIPVIFASSLLSLPSIIGQFFSTKSTVAIKILQFLSPSCWFRSGYDWYISLGYLLYVVMIVAFAYFYTSITFNPNEVSENIKKQGGAVPGIRPGRPTADYFNSILKSLVFIGAIGLLIVCTIPMIIQGVFSMASLSFGGTSMIIVVGVVLETIQQVESQMLVRNYKGFLNN
ncbi:MAG: preprotein translocase subunit SecY [Lachnospiraceae bacterium]|nr:preprotein translocase subunit SecY [Lachnospiraceae bacterium]